MQRVTKIALALAALLVATVHLSGEASAHDRRYPLTRCGPGLEYLCPIHGYFDTAPFRYEVAIYPGCIRTVPVETPSGVTYRRMVVCGAPQRQMVWW